MSTRRCLMYKFDKIKGRTESMCTGVRITISYFFGFPVCGSTSCSSLRCTRTTTLRVCVISIGARLFLFEKCSVPCVSGTVRSICNVHGPGPIKLDINSDRSSWDLRREWSVDSVAGVTVWGSGRSGVSSSLDRRERSSIRRSGSLRRAVGEKAKK